MNKDMKNAVLAVAIIIVLWLLYIFSFNQFMNKKWNNGVCPSCGYKYELRGKSSGTNYYICPYCGEEVERKWLNK